MIRTYHSPYPSPEDKIMDHKSNSFRLDVDSFPPLTSIHYSSDFEIKNMFQSIFNKGTRMEKADLLQYETEYRNFCKLLKSKNENLEIREAAYSMIGHMRDYKYGRGERDISYMMICAWYDEMDTKQALQMIRSWLGLAYLKIDGSVLKPSLGPGVARSLGSWKDIKYLPKYVFSKYMTKDHPIIQYCVQLAIEQLMKDYLHLVQSSGDKLLSSILSISMVAKWLPRENSSLHWLYELLVHEWTLCNMKYLLRGNVYVSASSENKAKQTFRKWVSRLNAHLGTKEIYECNQAISDIDVSKLSYKSLWELSLSETGCDISGLGIDVKNTKYQENARYHILCNPQNIPLEEYVKKGCEILDAPFCDPVQISLINYLWKKQIESTQGEPFHTVIPFLNLYYDNDEVHTSLHNLHICRAIGIACFISQKSLIHNRIFLSRFYCGTPKHILIQLSECHNFMDMLREIRTYIQCSTLPRSNSVSMTEAIRDGMNIVADSILETHIEPHKVIPVFIHNHPDFSYPDPESLIIDKRQHIVLWNTCSSENMNASGLQIVYLTGTSPMNITYLSRLGITIDNHLTVSAYDMIHNILAPYNK